MNWKILIAAGAILFSGAIYAQSPSPGGVHQNLALWLGADSGVIETGGSVSRWQDQSLQSRDAWQDSPAYQPTLVPGFLNGNPVLRFNTESWDTHDFILNKLRQFKCQEVGVPAFVEFGS
jgi:hypothetical protein